LVKIVGNPFQTMDLWGDGECQIDKMGNYVRNHGAVSKGEGNE
jgi:hypothetical protein